MRSLIDKLNEASNAYYNTGNPIMSDSEWDIQYDTLQSLEKRSGLEFNYV